MSGSSTALASNIGAVDAYVSANEPAASLFKPMDIERLNKSTMEKVTIPFEGTAGFGRTVQVTIPHTCDILHEMWIRVSLGTLSGNDTYVNEVGNAMIEEVKVSVGSVDIDKHTGEWMHLCNELERQPHKKYTDLVGNFASSLDLKKWSQTSPLADGYTAPLLIPLQFWFCKAIEQGFPMVALKGADLRISITFKDWVPLTTLSTTAAIVAAGGSVAAAQATAPAFSAALLCNYRYLLDEDRLALSENPQSYLIDVVQYTGATAVTASGASTSKVIDLNFNNAVKELVVVVSPATARANKNAFSYATWSDAKAQAATTFIQDPVASLKVSLNAHDTSDFMSGAYWRGLVPRSRHTSVGLLAQDAAIAPADDLTLAGRQQAIYTWCINSLRPEEWQPSGSVNMSVIAPVKLHLNLNRIQGHLRTDAAAASSTTGVNEAEIRVYARSINVLFFANGSCGTKFP